MDPINNIARLMELLRRQQNAPAPTQRKSGKKTAAAASQRQTASIGALKHTVVEQLKLQPRDGSASQRRARVLQSILAWQFGSDILDDPGLADLIEQMQQHIESDPAFCRRYDAVIEKLSRSDD